MPGANTYGSLSNSSRRRVAGSVHRDAGTVRPGGRSGVCASDLIVMVELAELRAAALRLLRLARRLTRGSTKDRPVLARRGLGAVEAVHCRHGRASCVPENAIRQIVCLDRCDQLCL